MTGRTEIELSLDRYLADGAERVPDRVIDAALDQIDSTSQRRALRVPWRFDDMPSVFKLALAAAAVIAVVLSGLLLTRGPTGTTGGPAVGTPLPSAPAPAAATPPASAAPASTLGIARGARPIPAVGTTDPGRYYVDNSSWTSAPFAFTMPLGWAAQNAGVSKHSNVEGREIGWRAVIVDRLFVDPCGGNDTTGLGPFVDALVAALVDIPGASGREDIVLDGRRGSSVELTLPPDVDESDCDPPIGFQIAQDRGGSYLLVGEGVITKVYVVDISGGRFVLVAHFRPTTPADEMAELEAMINSIEIEE
jgi:hypothetical protein